MGLAVFSLGIIIAVSLLTTALRVQRRSIVMQNVQDNGRYLISFMAKEIRMSEINNVSDGETTVLDITHPLNGDITYTFSGSPGWQIIREDGSGAESINSDEVQVEGRFFIDGRTAGDNEQPRVAIVIEVRTSGTKSEEQAKINLQTALSQRNLE